MRKGGGREREWGGGGVEGEDGREWGSEGVWRERMGESGGVRGE